MVVLALEGLMAEHPDDAHFFASGVHTWSHNLEHISSISVINDK